MDDVHFLFFILLPSFVVPPSPEVRVPLGGDVAQVDAVGGLPLDGEHGAVQQDHTKGKKRTIVGNYVSQK